MLDEPSIGLHPRDMHRVIEVMHRLRSAGNSLVVVEHDPQVMLAADRLLDMGPGPGERGGAIVFNGTPEQIKQARTLTGEYLAGTRQVEVPTLDAFGRATRNVPPETPKLILEGAREHNLQDLQVEFPLGKLVVVTGVSGSGKSTLVQDVLYPALCKAKGKSTETPGTYDRLLGDDWIADVAMVDQSPIGKTTRSNPASYVGAWDAIRGLFAKTGVAAERGYGPGMFSFNAGDGRCPTCGGNGFEHVEMQFLSDVYLRCPDCDGKRFRPEVLEIALERSFERAQAVGRRRARPHGQPGAAVLRRRARGRACAQPARRRRPRVREARAAGADAVGRRGAAPQDRGLPRRGGEARCRPASRSAASWRARVRCFFSMSRPPACTSTTSRA